MAYKEPKFNKEGAKALYDALTQMNDQITSKGKKKKKPSNKKSNSK